MLARPASGQSAVQCRNNRVSVPGRGGTGSCFGCSSSSSSSNSNNSSDRTGGGRSCSDDSIFNTTGWGSDGGNKKVAAGGRMDSRARRKDINTGAGRVAERAALEPPQLTNGPPAYLRSKKIPLR